jgi:hypothetical protein
MLPACVLPSPGNGGAGAAGAAASDMLAPPGSKRAAHFGLVEGAGCVTTAPAEEGPRARSGWDCRSA